MSQASSFQSSEVMDEDWFDDDDDDFMSQVNMEDMDTSYAVNTSSLNMPSNSVSTNQFNNVQLSGNISATGTTAVPPLASSSPQSRKRPSENDLDEETSSILPSRKFKVFDRNLFNSNFGGRNETTITTPSKIPPRRFPGPAGVLPTLKPSEFKLLDKSHTVSQQIDQIITNDKIVKLLLSPSSQTSSSTASTESEADCLSQSEKLLFERNTWSQLLYELDLDLAANHTSVLNLLNIRWIQRSHAIVPPPAKMPFLLVILQESPEMNGRQCKTPCVRCVDPTGSIEAAIDYKFATEYASDLTPGTSLALKNVGILRLRRDQVMITITERNLIFMTSSSLSEDKNNKLTSNGNSSNSKFQLDSSQKSVKIIDDVKITRFSEFLPEQIMNNYEKLISQRDTVGTGVTGALMTPQEREFNQPAGNHQTPMASSSKRTMPKYFLPAFSSDRHSLGYNNNPDNPNAPLFNEDDDLDAILKDIGVDSFDDSMDF